MKFIHLVLVGLGTIVAPINAAPKALDPQCYSRFHKIVGGTDAVKREFPFQVSLQDNSPNSHFCGGSLIGKKWVLTAAHCAGIDHVEIGRHALSAENDPCVEKIKVLKEIKHPNYNSNTLENDILLLELAGESSYLPVSPATSAQAALLEAAGKSLTVSGWGSMVEGGGGSNFLQKVDVPVQSQQSCKQAYSAEDIYPSMICAGFAQGGKDSCQGDSGGPLFAKTSDSPLHFSLVGIVSWGAGCAQPGQFGVYTRVSSFGSFICSKTGLYCDTVSSQPPSISFNPPSISSKPPSISTDSWDGSHTDSWGGSHTDSWDTYTDTYPTDSWGGSYTDSSGGSHTDSWDTYTYPTDSWDSHTDSSGSFGPWDGSYTDSSDYFGSSSGWTDNSFDGDNSWLDYYADWFEYEEYESEGECSADSDCTDGNYCDKFGSCWSCNYVDPWMCDSITGDCCSPSFRNQCSLDPYKCDAGHNYSDSMHDDHSDSMHDIDWWGEWNPEGEEGGSTWWEGIEWFGPEEWDEDHFDEEDHHFSFNDSTWWFPEDDFEFEDAQVFQCTTDSDCSQGHYCDLSNKCYTCEYIDPWTCDSKDQDCCSPGFLAQCTSDPHMCKSSSPTPAYFSAPTPGPSSHPNMTIPTLPSECRRRYSNSKIVGGTDAIKREFPFQVSLQDKSMGHFCGGTLISPVMVLTAAHCGKPSFVRVGLHSLKDDTACTEEIEVADYIKHPDYDSFTMLNDIAIIQLKRPSAYASIQPMSLALATTLEMEGTILTASGWGTLKENGDISNILQKVQVPVMSFEECSKAYTGSIYPSNLCAGLPEGGKDTCQGDSGGPLFVFHAETQSYYQVGITSWGEGCANAMKPGVYTRVSSHLPFICKAAGVGCKETEISPSKPPTVSTNPPTASTNPPTTSTNPPSASTNPPSASTNPPSASTIPPTISTNPPSVPQVAPTPQPTRQGASSQVGFNWGSCGAGTGTFDVELPVAKTSVSLGMIPQNIGEVRVYLDAQTDIDIVLYDIDKQDTFREGQAVVAWCNTEGCNSGVVGSSSSVASAMYNGMNVEYSGYLGDGTPTGKGKEYIKLDPVTVTNLEIRVFAYEAGSANVRYEYGASTSGCCLGTEACRGSFTTYVPQGGIVEIGQIPKNKRDVKIFLESSADVDVQLYDLDDKSKHNEGKALIAFCAEQDCNVGVINSPSATSHPYWGMKYFYSGYNGRSGRTGHESIEIEGITNRNLAFKAYGFSAGQAVVNYEYWEPKKDEKDGFVFDNDCGAGAGEFEVKGIAKGKIKNIGTIPAGVWDVKIFLDSNEDLDVSLFDLSDTTKYGDGASVVGWCSKSKDQNCNMGVLAANKEETRTYKDMPITYSGYEGTQGRPGSEYIYISGENKVPLQMKAFAFKTGDATVRYEYGAKRDACCMGEGPCRGSFSAFIFKDTIVEIGRIPIMKKNLRVTLKSNKDVDIQLYDTANVRPFSEGKAVVAFCAQEGCNKGVLGFNAKENSAMYNQRKYTYSGFNGVNGQPGHEFVKVEGETNTPLTMKAYGFVAGKAEVEYEWWNDPTQRSNVP